ncbi:MAG: hypothetical protein AAF386_06680, partial [Pseudomonadota bacterium]
GRSGRSSLGRSGADADLAALADTLEHPAQGPDLLVGDPVRINGFVAFRDAALLRDAMATGGGGVLVSTAADQTALACFAKVHGWSLDPTPGGVWVTPISSQPTPTLQRCLVRDETWDRLDAFAKRTYVPESDQARTSGAGAGLTDND